MTALSIGVNLPTLGEGAHEAASGGPSPAERARHAEQLGFESVWVPDLMTGDGMPALESTAVAAAAAAATERVRIGFGVYVVALRPVVWTAAHLATLQHLSRGRVLFGVGSGGFPRAPFWLASGAAAHDRGARTDAALRALPGLVGGEPTLVDTASQRVEITNAPAAPVPPVLVGGNSSAALRRTVEYGDSWFPSLITPETLGRRVERMRSLASAHGRGVPGVTVGGHLVPGEGSTARAARESLVSSLTDQHGMSADEAERIPISGGTAEMAERLAAYAASGAQRVVVSLDGADWMHGCETLAEAARLL
ncbi:alkanesulfonate monooxygenase SsuD/methylene tetrahydromethanopterin reductase-like flavin-dependent oxidoreductase (luciferase family) [Haloactinospora alba]|uniref:Alkanesulfonate monooxygenase SsuD/methylene tetrahydromethanopterin reductase-like flavin-dependent oxidoreductase (Luciferase family) n=2 Tax=Haloactinospora alba TaxID=405555 RepID=A0A543NKX5_9ACTN|nr:alkanesulfonate monooxygenase SsuD/methylene tetrahydromethanopterin reductase-like flavin-dependent oxidoreductase (luciferase family) [Haloactinospora alba]